MGTLTAVTAVYNTDNITYQNTLNSLNTLNGKGTDYIQLSYTISLSKGGKTVSVNFTKTTRTNGVNTTNKFTRSATLAAD